MGFYVSSSEESLIRRVAAAETINTEDTKTSGESKKQKAHVFKQNWSENKMHGQFVMEMPDFKIGTEALLCAAQEQAIRTSYVNHHSDKSSESHLCRLCRKKGESVQHLVNECGKLAQEEYKRRHGNVARKPHWDLSKRNGLEQTKKWFDMSQKEL